MGEAIIAVPFAALFLVLFFAISPYRWREQLVVAYLARLTLAVVHYEFGVLPDSQYDAIRFERVAALWAADGRCFDDFSTGSMLYSWIGSCIYLAFGRSSLLLQTLNCALGTLIVAFAMGTVQVVAPRTHLDRKIGWWLAVYPSLMLYSAITMREVAIVLPSVAAVYCLVKWRAVRRYRLLAWTVVWALVGQLFHTGMITMTVAVVAIGLFFVVKEHGRHLFAIRFGKADLAVASVTLVLMCVLVGVAWVAISAGYGVDKLQRLLTTDIVTALSSWQDEVARGRAGYLGSLSPRSALDLVAQVPIRMVYFLGAPFLWQVSGLRDVLGFIDGLVYVGLVIAIVFHARRGAGAHPTYRILVVLGLLVIVGFSLVTSNYGTAFRHRAKFFPILVSLVAYGGYLTGPVYRWRAGSLS